MFTLLWSYSYTALSQVPKHIDYALDYVGLTERTGNNDGTQIEIWQRAVGVSKGANWCAVFVSAMLTKAHVKYPSIRSALAKKFITNKSINARQVYFYNKIIPMGYILIWTHGQTWKGHTGFVLNWKGKSGRTVEGNCQNSVKIMYRKIEPYNYFRIIYFTPVTE